MQPIIPADKVPEAAMNRNAGYRYPWLTLKPGECFEFSPIVKVMSARIQCANNGNQLGRRFRCFRGTDGKIYAQRIDGLPDDPKKGKIVDAPVRAVGNTPATAETIGVFGEGCADNVKNLSTDHVHDLKGKPYPASEDDAI